LLRTKYFGLRLSCQLNRGWHPTALPSVYRCPSSPSYQQPNFGSVWIDTFGDLDRDPGEIYGPQFGVFFCCLRIMQGSEKPVVRAFRTSRLSCHEKRTKSQIVRFVRFENVPFQHGSPAIRRHAADARLNLPPAATTERLLNNKPASCCLCKVVRARTGTRRRRRSWEHGDDGTMGVFPFWNTHRVSAHRKRKDEIQSRS
jgi:hypothetical protein